MAKTKPGLIHSGSFNFHIDTTIINYTNQEYKLFNLLLSKKKKVIQFTTIFREIAHEIKI
jgi:DNA-binding response OmpR family regulator